LAAVAETARAGPPHLQECSPRSIGTRGRHLDITVYLPDELGNRARDHDLHLSRMLRETVEIEKRRREASAALAAETTTHELAVGTKGAFGAAAASAAASRRGRLSGPRSTSSWRRWRGWSARSPSGARHGHSSTGW
jgi:post-segregation antitoxin (ccd killing protein)